MRFPAIEGLRGWLAWAVVLDHLAYWSDRWGRLGTVLRELGHPAVLGFMCVSGFVITHLILSKPEPYSVYITRRFFRLFPLFAVTCILGYFAYRLQTQLPDPQFAPGFMALIQQTVEDTDRYFWAHVVAHITMLYGALPQNWLPSTDVAFNMPAWSISLEWQFYLLAPMIVGLLVRRPRLAPALVVAVVLLQVLFYQGWFGGYHQPATLPAAGEFFALGIVGRWFYPRLRGRRGCCRVLRERGRGGVSLPGGNDATLPKVCSYALANPIAIYLGSRSYSTYLGHFIVLVVCQHVAVRILGTAPSFSVLATMVIPATVLCSELLYRTIELPGIRLGSRLCNVLGLGLRHQSNPGARDLSRDVLLAVRMAQPRLSMHPDARSLILFMSVAMLIVTATLGLTTVMALVAH
jgi:peptidoglycan/LPS O-acetylase OafA/YrhL